jgi:hypothetical protein
MAQIWAAERVLDIHPDDRVLTCSGTTQKGGSCQNHISPADKQLARHVLDTLFMLDIVALGVEGNIVAQLLRNLAQCTLCKGVHRKLEAKVAVAMERFRQLVLGFVAVHQPARVQPVAIVSFLNWKVFMILT